VTAAADRHVHGVAADQRRDHGPPALIERVNMPKLRCRCGATINLSEVPNPAGIACFSEACLEDAIVKLTSTLAAAEMTEPDAIEALLLEHLVSRAGVPHGYECSNCGRVAVFRRASDTVPALWLLPEDPGGPRLTALADRHDSGTDPR
jgi:hypothetical protein